jgi:hypothetical protein
MTLQQYLKSMKYEDRLSFARRIGKSLLYLSTISGGHRKPSAQMARKISEESGWQVLPGDLLPEVFDGIPAKRKVKVVKTIVTYEDE